jgi:hypothetical protein
VLPLSASVVVAVVAVVAVVVVVGHNLRIVPSLSVDCDPYVVGHTSNTTTGHCWP